MRERGSHKVEKTVLFRLRVAGTQARFKRQKKEPGLNGGKGAGLQEKEQFSESQEGESCSKRRWEAFPQEKGEGRRAGGGGGLLRHTEKRRKGVKVNLPGRDLLIAIWRHEKMPKVINLTVWRKGG